MRKLRLEPEELKVSSIEMQAASGAHGTVRAQSLATQDPWGQIDPYGATETQYQGCLTRDPACPVLATQAQRLGA